MPVTIAAPHPYNQTTIVLRDPEWNDTVNLKDEVLIKRAINGTMYSYVKRQKTRRRLTMQFTLDSWKVLEVEAFFRCYYAARLKVIDHESNEWVGYAVNNPFEWITDGKAGKRKHGKVKIAKHWEALPNINGGEEMASFTLELEVVPLNQEQDL